MLAQVYDVAAGEQDANSVVDAPALIAAGEAVSVQTGVCNAIGAMTKAPEFATLALLASSLSTTVKPSSTIAPK